MSVSVWIYKKLGMKKIEYFENSPKKTSLELAYYFLGGGILGSTEFFLLIDLFLKKIHTDMYTL